MILERPHSAVTFTALHMPVFRLTLLSQVRLLTHMNAVRLRSTCTIFAVRKENYNIININRMSLIHLQQ